MNKDKLYTFRCNKKTVERLDKIAEELDIRTNSATIRFLIKEKYDKLFL